MDAPRAFAKERQMDPKTRATELAIPPPLRGEDFFATTKNRIRNDFSKLRGAPPTEVY
jgi:hypothetical protein